MSRQDRRMRVWPELSSPFPPPPPLPLSTASVPTIVPPCPKASMRRRESRIGRLAPPSPPPHVVFGCRSPIAPSLAKRRWAFLAKAKRIPRTRPCNSLDQSPDTASPVSNPSQGRDTAARRYSRCPTHCWLHFGGRGGRRRKGRVCLTLYSARGALPKVFSRCAA